MLEQTSNPRAQCPACFRTHRDLLERSRIEQGQVCTACTKADSSEPPFARPGRKRVRRGLARRFGLPQKAIKEMLEVCTTEELVDVLSGLEERGELERERAQWQRGHVRRHVPDTFSRLRHRGRSR